MLSFIFNGKDSYVDYGILIEKRPKIMTPKRRVTYIPVPGRHSNLRYDEKTYEDITIAVECSLKGNPYHRIDEITEWLIGSGEKDLVFSYQRDKKYIAQVVNNFDFSIALKITSKFLILFNCRPFKYAVENNPIEIETGDGFSLVNEGSVESRPVTKVYLTGEGAIKINNNEILLSALSSPYIVLDSELEEAYLIEDGIMVNANNSMAGEFPVLITGNNTIFFSGGITKLEITPYWRWL